MPGYISTFSERVIAAANLLGVSYRLLSDQEADSVRRRVMDQFTPARKTFHWLWESSIKDNLSIQDPDGWRQLDEFLAGKPFLLCFNETYDRAVFAFAAGVKFVSLYAEVVGIDEFYLTDAEATYLVCENHHQILYAAGDAKEWLDTTFYGDNTDDVADDDYFLNIEQAAELLDVSEAVVQNSIQIGRLKSYRIFGKGEELTSHVLLSGIKEIIREKVSLCRASGDKDGISSALECLANIAYRWGTLAFHDEEYEVARSQYAESLALCHETGDVLGSIFVLEGMASVFSATSAWNDAAVVLGTCAILRKRINVPLTLDQQFDYDEGRDKMRSALGEEKHAAAWAEGRALSLEQAIKRFGNGE